MLDEVRHRLPEGGFNDHPHCGIEIITYTMDGEFLHEDSKGN